MDLAGVDDGRSGPSRRTTTSPTRASPRRSSSRSGCSDRCCSKARRASARPRSPRCSPAGPAASCCGSSATRASTPSQAVYEWDYSRQLLHLRAVEASGAEVVEDELYSEALPREAAAARARSRTPAPTPPVLLVDEVDRADDEFEAFLLEILSDWSISVPELGVIRAEVPPIAVLTSNRTRDVHDALKRRCLYHWIAHPDFERELAILRVRAPGGTRPAGARRRGRGGGAARLRAVQAARRRGDDRLGAGARDARHRRGSTSTRSTSRSARSSSTARTRSGCGTMASSDLVRTAVARSA